MNLVNHEYVKTKTIEYLSEGGVITHLGVKMIKKYVNEVSVPFFIDLGIVDSTVNNGEILIYN